MSARQRLVPSIVRLATHLTHCRVQLVEAAVGLASTLRCVIVQNININSLIGNIVNSGNIQALTGNINIGNRLTRQ